MVAARSSSGSAGERAARKAIARLDKQLERVTARETELNEQMAAYVADHEKLGELSRELHALHREKEDLEAEWLEAAESLS